MLGLICVMIAWSSISGRSFIFISIKRNVVMKKGDDKSSCLEKIYLPFKLKERVTL